MKINTPIDFEPKSLPFFNEWIAALESGEYPQGYGQLERLEHYCCLGVLCKIQGRLNCGRDGSDMFHLATSNPCFPILELVGEFPPGCSVSFLVENIEYKVFFRLSNLNDSGLASFSDIATVIKTFWKA